MKFQNVAAIAALSLAAGPAHAQDPAASGSIIRTETKVVLVDAIVTDKKGNYIQDLTAKDFKVYEDNKEQNITSFSFEAGPNGGSGKRRYLILFFDNSTMNPGDQIQARESAAKFIDGNAGPNRPMAIVNFSGGVQIAQNFTEDPERLKNVVKGLKMAATSPKADAGLGPALSASYADFGARDMLLALRGFAKSLAAIPGRKTLVLLSSGFPVRPEYVEEAKAAIDACNKSNTAIYPIDVRGLVAPGSSPHGMLFAPPVGQWQPHFETVGFQRASPPPPPAGGGRTATPTPTFGGGATAVNQYLYNQALISRSSGLIPRPPETATVNQQILYMLADGTGGFLIKDTNDLLGGLEKIGKEQDEYYLLGYTPPQIKEGICHELKVKVEHGAVVRSRSGYCDAKPRELLAGASVEKQLEAQLLGAAAGNMRASMVAPFFYAAPNIARVNVVMEISTDAMKFEKEKGKFHGTVNLLGIAYRPDGSVAGRFSDTVKRDFDSKQDMQDAKDKPLHYENQFEMGPGQYTLKVALSGGGDTFGKVESPLAIELYDGTQFIVSSLVMTTNVRAAGDVNADSGETLLLEDRRPLIAKGVRFFPAGSMRFKSTDHPVIYVEVYEPDLLKAKSDNVVGVAMEVKVLDRKTGAEKAVAPAFRLDTPAQTGNPVIATGVKLPGPLAAGAYRVEVRAFDGVGKTFTRTADFDIE